jgi:hypothetical protein
MKSTYPTTNPHMYRWQSTYRKSNPHTPILIDAFNAPITVGIEYHPEWNELMENANMQLSEGIYELIFNIGQSDNVPVE